MSGTADDSRTGDLDRLAADSHPAADSHHLDRHLLDSETLVGETLDLDAVERDLDHVEQSLEGLDPGDYWNNDTTDAARPDDA